MATDIHSINTNTGVARYEHQTDRMVCACRAIMGFIAEMAVAVPALRKNRVRSRHRESLVRVAGQALPPLSHRGAYNTVLLIDRSTSMLEDDFAPNRITAAKRAAREYVWARVHRSRQDSIAVVAFSGRAKRVSGWHSLASDLTPLLKRVEEIDAGGSTSIGAGLVEAEALLFGGWRDIFRRIFESSTGEPIPTSGLRRVILLTDGGENEPPDSEPVAERLKQAGVVIECVGIGAADDVNESLLRTIASTVDGRVRYRYIADADDLLDQYRRLGGSITR